MTDEKKTAQQVDPDGEVDNSFAGAVDADDALLADAASDAENAGQENAEASENLQTKADEAEASESGAEETSESPAEAEHPDTTLAAERLADLQRLQAEYVNYRNRVERDRAREKDATIGSVVESFIPVLDEIELARQHGELSGAMEKIADKIETVLSRYGVSSFGEANEAFDPNFHEALMHVEAEAPEGVDGTFVVQVLQKGFKVNDRIIRAARVSVAGE